MNKVHKTINYLIINKVAHLFKLIFDDMKLVIDQFGL